MRLGNALRSPSPALVASALAVTLVAGLGAAAREPAGSAATDTAAMQFGTLDVGGLAAAPAAPLPDAVAPVPPPPLPAPAGPAPEVAPLTELRAPDLLVTVPATLRPEQVAALGALPNLSALSVLDAGTVRVAGQDARLLGVDPSTFRAFTPQETAQSDDLWRAVARGEVAPTYVLARDRQLTLEGPITMAGSAEVPGRVGALAAFGLPGVDLVTDTTKARSLGVVPASAVLVSAPQTSISALKKAVQGALGPDSVVEVLRPEVAKAPKGKPRNYRDLYIDSARYCKGLSWTVLAAIGQVESGHGKNLGPSSAGALGPMQFLPSTWAAYGVDGDGDGQADIMSPYDAVPSAAAYLCRFGANRGPDGLYDAIFAYNRADWYVQKVLGLAAQYR